MWRPGKAVVPHRHEEPASYRPTTTARKHGPLQSRTGRQIRDVDRGYTLLWSRLRRHCLILIDARFSSCSPRSTKAPVPPENIFPIPTDGEPEDAARRYERTLQEAYGAPTLDPSRPLFDTVLLGMGDDGHAASLLPGDKLLDERQHWVAAVAHGRPEVRITMTYPVIESSRQVAFLVAGAAKAAMLSVIRAGGSQLPAARLRPVGELIWFADRAAASGG